MCGKKNLHYYQNIQYIYRMKKGFMSPYLDSLEYLGKIIFSLKMW